MVNKKGEGVRGVLGDLVSRDKERREHPKQPAEIAPTHSTPDRPGQPEPIAHPGNAVEPLDAGPGHANPPRKATGIKGRPRGRKDDDAVQRERTKITLSIDEELRDKFYRLAHAEMIQPGEFVERALRYYINHHLK